MEIGCGESNISRSAEEEIRRKERFGESSSAGVSCESTVEQTEATMEEDLATLDEQDIAALEKGEEKR